MRVVIEGTRDEITVQVFGSCWPIPCDWGTVSGLCYAPNVDSTQAIAFSALYGDHTLITGLLDHGTLIVETYGRSPSGSRHSNYCTKDYFWQSKGH